MLELVVIIIVIYDLYFIRNKIVVYKHEIVATENFVKSIKHHITYRFLTFDRVLLQFCVIYKHILKYTVVPIVFNVFYKLFDVILRQRRKTFLGTIKTRREDVNTPLSSRILNVIQYHYRLDKNRWPHYYLFKNKYCWM